VLARRLPRDVVVVGIDPRWADFDLPRAAIVGKFGLLVRSDIAETSRVPTPWLDETLLVATARRHGGENIQPFMLDRIVAKQNYPGAVILPRPR
jgi:hypothetical protein